VSRPLPLLAYIVYVYVCVYHTEVELQPFPAITFRTIGGVLDMYVFLGPTPDSVIQQYTAVIGLPVMPPYWALGFQLCKYGYNSAAHLKDVITRNRQLGIPYVCNFRASHYSSCCYCCCCVACINSCFCYIFWTVVTHFFILLNVPFTRVQHRPCLDRTKMISLSQHDLLLIV